MGKNARHKKLLKSEKAKVKLKAKKLPKDTNVTDTNFKIKKIVINKQLESHDDLDLLTKRKLNLKDLLVRTRHYNVQSRKDALSGIRELISSHSTELVAKHLNELLEYVPKLTVDIERSVRKECFQVLHVILSSVSDIKLLPYYKLLICYLCCAMTHINPNIQEDSLIFMDLLIQTTPTLLSDHFMKIFPSFLNLISKIQNESKIERKLSTVLNNKQTTTKWRTKVLQRLDDLLTAVVLSKNPQRNSNTSMNVNKKYDVNCYNFFPIYNNNFLQCVPLSVLNGADSNNGEDILLNCVNTIVPLLFATWMECRPNDVNFEFESAISEEALSILNHILKIFKLIWIHLKHCGNLNTANALKGQFYKQFDENFGKYFIENFPYNKIENTVQNRQTNGRNLSDFQCWEQNLEVVNLFLKFHPVLRQQKYRTKFDDDIFQFLKHCISNSGKLNSECSAILCDVLKDCFSINFNKLHKYEMNSILSMTISNFNKKLFHESKRNDIFDTLCNVLENDKLARCDEYQLFLKTLPTMLGDDRISMPILYTVAKLCRQNNKIIINGIKDNLVKIISNFEALQLSMSTNENETTPFEILEQILYYVKK